MGPVGVSSFLVVVSLVLSGLNSLSASDDYSSIFEDGTYHVKSFHVPGKDPFFEKTTCSDVPSAAGEKPLRTLFIVAPNVSREQAYPVVHLQHGFMLKTGYYCELMRQVASHGFIVIAPQMERDILKIDASDEIAQAAAVINWYPNNLARAIASEVGPSIEPNLTQLALVGHSRGGKVSFALAKGMCKASLEYIAIAGLEPADGSFIDTTSPPQVLPHTPQGLNLSIPTLILGARLAQDWYFVVLPPCGPEGVNQVDFYEDSAAPAVHFVARDYGHMDFLDQQLDAEGDVLTAACKPGTSRPPMRSFAGGMVVAFLQASIFGDRSAIDYYLNNPQMAPIKLKKSEQRGWFQTYAV